MIFKLLKGFCILGTFIFTEKSLQIYFWIRKKITFHHLPRNLVISDHVPPSLHLTWFWLMIEVGINDTGKIENAISRARREKLLSNQSEKCVGGDGNLLGAKWENASASPTTPTPGSDNLLQTISRPPECHCVSGCWAAQKDSGIIIQERAAQRDTLGAGRAIRAFSYTIHSPNPLWVSLSLQRAERGPQNAFLINNAATLVSQKRQKADKKSSKATKLPFSWFNSHEFWAPL
jgi:hypothetical protein